MTRPEKDSAAGFTWKIVFLTTLVVLGVSFIQVYIVYPRFIRRTVEDCRNEAVRAARNISRIVNLDGPLVRGHLTAATLDRISEITQDFQLWKLKVFSPEGEVLFSTDGKDVGKFNKHGYFFENVADGEVYSKAVWQKTVTLEGQVVPVDVVETYVPIMKEGKFLGACEISYNITDRKSGLDRLIAQASMLTLANARHAMLSSPRKVLTVETGSGDGRIFMVVADTGCGIPEDRLSQVFTPFFSTKGEHAVDPAQSRVKGTGLGLSICHTIVTNHGGRIGVESRVGSGTTFTVSLPLPKEREVEETG